MPSDDRSGEYKEAFDLFDKDGDGMITTKELGTVLRALGKSPTEAEVAKIVKEIDPDNRGQVSFPEFRSVMDRDMQEFNNEKDLRNAWKVFDKENKGFILITELRHILSSIGEKLSPDELDELSKEADPEGKGRVQCEDFLRIMMTTAK